MPKAAKCECLEKTHNGPCPNEPADAKYVRCRPCACGWHLRAPCTEFQPEPFPQVVKTCHRCGHRHGLDRA